MASARAVAAKATGVDGRGLCPTTTIHLVHGCCYGPALAIPAEMVLQRLQLLEAEPARYCKALVKAHARLTAAKHMWACVSGVVSGCIATLLGLGWDLQGPADWVSPCGA
eukprot:13637061-Alexandrium_andersonii.AAC.1